MATQARAECTLGGHGVAVGRQCGGEREDEGVRVRTADLALTERTSYNLCLPFSKELLEKLSMNYIG